MLDISSERRDAASGRLPTKSRLSPCVLTEHGRFRSVRPIAHPSRTDEAKLAERRRSLDVLVGSALGGRCLQRLSTDATAGRDPQLNSPIALRRDLLPAAFPAPALVFTSLRPQLARLVSGQPRLLVRSCKSVVFALKSVCMFGTFRCPNNGWIECRTVAQIPAVFGGEETI